MRNWDDVRAWRKSMRAELLAWRELLTEREVGEAASVVAEKLLELAVLREAGSIGFYWPFKGELDLGPMVRALVETGTKAALPVVVEKNQPVEFWVWSPDMELERGMWDTQVPPVREPIAPDVLLIPLVGFDMAGYRLGHGGGYYDRTLAAADPKPTAIGVGYQRSRVETIFPQPHDIPMDVIVTEAPVERPMSEADSPGHYASSPCFLHEFD